MSHRLQVLVSEELNARLAKAAKRQRLSKGELVRRAIESSLQRSAAEPGSATDPLASLASLAAPTGDIDEMLAEIEAGRR